MTPLQKNSARVVVVLSLAGTLAGCATSATLRGPYRDGTYRETATYESPNGTEEIDVTVSLKKDVITTVTVAGQASGPQAQFHQSEFRDGISAVVVGKNIDEISVNKVGGSSLTSGGFSKAIEAIKADAHS
jgi:hypothetical protein